MEFNQGFADFDSVYEFYYFMRKNHKYLFKEYLEQAEFLFDFDEIMMNIQYRAKRKHVEFLKLQLFH